MMDNWTVPLELILLFDSLEIVFLEHEHYLQTTYDAQVLQLFALILQNWGTCSSVLVPLKSVMVITNHITVFVHTITS